MKLAVYEVRDDEKEELKKQAEKYSIKLIMTDEALNEDTISLAEGCTGISILGYSKGDKEMLRKLMSMNIGCVSTRTIGYNHIDTEFAKEIGMKVCNASYEPNGVADYTVMVILMLLRSYKPAMYRANVNDYSLKGLQGREMKDLTIGIMGTGRIGQAVIKNLSGFGSRLLAYDLYQNEGLKQLAEYVDLDTFYADCDIISLHMPLTDNTYHMINKGTLSKMKDAVILINCARGDLMDMTDIIEGIENEKIGALGLDVFKNEQGIYHQDRRTDIIKNREMAYIRQFPNVILTQHMAFYTDAAVASMVQDGIEGLVMMCENKEFKNQIV